MENRDYNARNTSTNTNMEENNMERIMFNTVEIMMNPEIGSKLNIIWGNCSTAEKVVNQIAHIIEETSQRCKLYDLSDREGEEWLHLIPSKNRAKFREAWENGGIIWLGDISTTWRAETQKLSSDIQYDWVKEKELKQLKNPNTIIFASMADGATEENMAYLKEVWEQTAPGEYDKINWVKANDTSYTVEEVIAAMEAAAVDVLIESLLQ